MAKRRLIQVGEEIRRVISDLLQRELRDPRLGFVTITRVEMSPDLRLAKVFVSVLGSEEEQQDSMAALQHAKGFIRKNIAEQVNLRFTPELAFRLDHSMEHADRVMRLLKDIEEAEHHAPSPNDGTDSQEERAPE